jgi:hypothetical protein
LPVFVGGRRLVLVPLAVVFALGLTGCSGSSDSPTTLPPISTTPAASQSTAPATDAKAAALAVVKEYFRLLNNLENDMAVASFARLESASCSCRKLLTSLREARRRSQHYFGMAQVRSMKAVVDTPTAVEVLVTYDSTAGGLKGEDGSVITRAPGRNGVTENFYLQKLSSGWRIVNLVPVRRGTPK